jgi:hypothetical protein
MKIKCEICGNLGQLQHLSENYYRVKHYLGSVNGKLRFEYHKQSLEYIKRVLDSSSTLKTIDPIDQKSIDLKLNSNGLESQKKEGRSSSLVRTLALRAKGRRFKSGPAHIHFLPNHIWIIYYTGGRGSQSKHIPKSDNLR